jgi:lipid-A-disaccharide synthase
VGIFPGSRLQEVRSLMPLFRRIVDGMGLDPKSHQVLVSACKPEFRPIVEEAFRGLTVPVRLEEGDSRTLMAACDFALVASGTASLELAYFGKPMIVLYRVAAYAMLVYRWLGVNPFISLVNILGRGEVVPERVVVRDEPVDLAPLARDLLLDTPARRGCLKRLDALREEGFQPGGTERAARRLLEFLEERQIPGVRGFLAAPGGAPRKEA